MTNNEKITELIIMLARALLSHEKGRPATDEEIAEYIDQKLREAKEQHG